MGLSKPLFFKFFIQVTALMKKQNAKNNQKKKIFFSKGKITLFKTIIVSYEY